ncbi:substrate-binding and VWA domain-containing protein [Thermobifida cellulosilytica]|uniref:von Willebrand factor A n=1 Tax=Thermobifida cellulosilytica TB100 TaxID=665004 RepID=A0A147KDH8_THECS|nr:substrate-binding and VWA domain-containing protein [Thermobifida cellulosilytica]KUP95299.1 von Willebrand factor A [Thermobifida cellulosilytica TB100]
MGRHRGSSADDTAPDPRRRGNRRRRRGTGRAFAAFAAALAVLVGLGVTGYFVLDGRLGCGGSTPPLQVAAAPELAPVLTRLADDFNAGDTADSRCVTVEVRGADSADVAYSITGAGPTMGGTESQVWIPDSTLWVKTVQRDADDAVVSTGTSVAHSPLVLVTTQAAGADASETPLSWDNLVPTEALPDPGSSPYQVHVIDPVNSSSGLATLALVSNSVSGEEGPQTRFIAALQNLQKSVVADEEAALAVISEAPADAEQAPLLVLSEQAAWRLSTQTDSAVHVIYPERGTYTLDYPYVLRSKDPEVQLAAEAFRAFLTGREAQQAIRAEGFRSADEAIDPETLTEEHGFRADHPGELPAPGEQAAKSLIQAWNQLKLGTRLLTVVDISGSMAEIVPGTGLTRMQVTSAAAIQGLTLFPSEAEMGLWEFSVGLDGDRDYRETVPIRPLEEQVDGVTQHEVLNAALARLAPEPDGDTGLYDTILAAYQELTESYAPNRVNTLLVLTDGNNDDDDSISLDDLVQHLEEAYQPDRPVTIIAISFGPDVDPEPLQRIAEATRGAAYTTEDPTEIGEIFLSAFALRISGETEEEE